MIRKVLVFSLVALCAAVPVPGENTADKIRNTVSGTVEIRQETQQKEDRWALEQAELQSRYRAAKAQIASLEKQKELSARKVEVLQRRSEELKRRIEESERLDANLHEILEGIMARLKGWVATDLPFLHEERAARLAFLEETLARADVSSAEKLRHLLEALLVECEYGDTLEVYEQSIDVGGETVFARVFRLGRLSVFWQTPDGARVGEYDRSANRWVDLPAEQVRSISAAVEMAEKRRPVELIRLPVGRINP